MTGGDIARTIAHFEAIGLDELRQIVAARRRGYTPEALELARDVLEQRTNDPHWVAPGERVRCPDCGHTDGLATVRVFLPSDTPDGVTPFDARSCRGCGLTTFVRTDELERIASSPAT